MQQAPCTQVLVQQTLVPQTPVTQGLSSKPLCHKPLCHNPLWLQTLVQQPPYTACRCSSRTEGSDRRLGSCALLGGGGGHPNRAGEEACWLDPDCRPRGRAGDVHRDAACLASRLCAAHSSWACALPVRHLPGICHLPRICQRSGLSLPMPWHPHDYSTRMKMMISSGVYYTFTRLYYHGTAMITCYT